MSPTSPPGQPAKNPLSPPPPKPPAEPPTSVVLVAYPKVVFLYPVFLLSIIGGILPGLPPFSGGQAAGDNCDFVPRAAGGQFGDPGLRLPADHVADVVLLRGGGGAGLPAVDQVQAGRSARLWRLLARFPPAWPTPRSTGL